MWLLYWNFTESKSFFCFCPVICWWFSHQLFWRKCSSLWELQNIVFSCCKRWENEYIEFKAQIVSFCRALPSIKRIFLFLILRTLKRHSIVVTLHCSDFPVIVSSSFSFVCVHIFSVFFTPKHFWKVFIIPFFNFKKFTFVSICRSNANMLICRILSANFFMVCTNFFSYIHSSTILTLEKWLFSFDHIIFDKNYILLVTLQVPYEESIEVLVPQILTRSIAQDMF